MTKKIVSIFILSMLMLCIWAGSFEIESYDIAIKANKDGRLDITETIDVRFFEESHGIYRDIQYRFDNPNGNDFDPIVAEISQVKTNTTFKTDKENGILRIILGDEDRIANERERYVIQYSYHLDYNRTVGYDELYYNIISPSWDNSISNITWSISLPYPVEKDRIWVTEGKEGGTRAGSFTLNGNNTLIEGEKDLLLPFSAITVRVEMDEEYWKGWKTQEDNSLPFVVAGFIIAILFTLFSGAAWFLYGKDKKIDTSAMRTTPPEGINPLEAGFIIDQSSSPEKEGFAMIFKWAEEGRLTVREIKGKDDKPSYSFHKIKDLDEGANKSERFLFDSVFFKDEVSLEDIVNHGFANDYLLKVVKALTKENKSHKERKSIILQTVFLIADLFAILTSSILFSIRYPGILSLLMVLAMLIPSFLIAMIAALYSESGKIWTKITKIIICVISSVIILGGAALVFLLGYQARLSLFTLIVLPLSFMLFILSSAFSSLMDRKTYEGNKKLKECIEYRNYLAALLEGRAEPSEEDKKMWGTHMAYALALGLKTKGENLKLDMPQPIWFYGSWHSGWFTYFLLFHSCSSSYTNTVFKSSGSTTPGGGGFSSSGFAGGGFSGGGGGSW